MEVLQCNPMCKQQTKNATYPRWHSEVLFPNFHLLFSNATEYTNELGTKILQLKIDEVFWARSLIHDNKNASESFSVFSFLLIFFRWPRLEGLVPSRYLYVLGEKGLDTSVMRGFTGRVEKYSLFSCLLP